MGNKMSLNLREARALRADARRLETVAKHLRLQARELVREDRLRTTKAEFFSKTSHIDPKLTLTPLVEESIDELLQDEA